MEKLKQLSKYIEPLRRMINKIDKNEGEGGTCSNHRAPPPIYQSQSFSITSVLSIFFPPDRKKDLSKMKSLLNILTDPNTR